MYYYHIIKLRLLSDLVDVADWYKFNIDAATQRLAKRWRHQCAKVAEYHGDVQP